MSAEQAAVMDALRQEADEQASETKTGEYIPSSETQADAMPDDMTTAQLLEMLLGPAFNILAPAWEVPPEEIRALAEADGAALDAWFPDGFLVGKYGALLAMAAVNIAVLGPRIKQPRHYPPKAKDPEPNDGD